MGATGRAIKAAIYVCPEKYCFFWHDNKCDEAYKSFDNSYDCIRKSPCQTTSRDWYEPCEPELDRDGLSHESFVVIK